MEDKDLQLLINDVIKAKNTYFSMLLDLENEYERRFGNNPSTVDDDCFIDTFHLKQGNSMTVKMMTDSASGRENKNNW